MTTMSSSPNIHRPRSALGARLRVLRLCALILALGSAAATAAFGQEVATTPPAATPGRPRVGVVLSGGSAKGFAHIGVLRELRRAGIPVDVITGTSMGSLVGGLHAIGYTPEEIERVASDMNWDALFTDAAGPRSLSMDGTWLDSRMRFPFPMRNGRLGLPTGVVKGQRIWQVLARLSAPALGVDDFRRFPVPFAAVATDIETGSAVVLDHGFLADALRASMSLPAVFAPFQLEGRLLVDGAVVRNLPSQEARALGADVLICSDVSGPLMGGSEIQSFVDVLMQTVSFQVESSSIQQRQLCDVMITPDISGLSSMAFDQVKPWVERGAVAARALMPEVTRVLNARQAVMVPTANVDARTEASHSHPESTRITSVHVEGGCPEGQAIARKILDQRLRLPIEVSQLDAVVGELYDTGLFDRVTYGVSGDESHRVLTVRLVDNVQDSFALGFHYDTRYQASLLFSTTFRNRLRWGSVTRLELRAGDQRVFYGQFMDRAGLASRLVLGVDGGYVRTPLDVYQGDTRVAEELTTLYTASAFVGTTIKSLGLARVQLRAEHAVNEMAVGPVNEKRSQTYYTLGGTLSRQGFDRLVFPSRGASLFAKAEIANRAFGSGADFWQTMVDVSGAVPVSKAVAVQARVVAGASGGEDLPFHYQFFLGGINTSGVFRERQFPHFGLRAQQQYGRSMQLARLGLQVQVSPRLFATVAADTGAAFNTNRFAPEDYRYGFGLTLGTPTPFGPLEVTVGTSKLTSTHAEFRFGYSF